MSYTLTYYDGETETITNEEEATLSENVDFCSYKRSYSKNYNSVTIEIGASVGSLGLKKTITYCRQQAEYHAKKAIEQD